MVTRSPSNPTDRKYSAGQSSRLQRATRVRDRLPRWFGAVVRSFRGLKRLSARLERLSVHPGSFLLLFIIYGLSTLLNKKHRALPLYQVAVAV